MIVIEVTEADLKSENEFLGGCCATTGFIIGSF